MDDQEAFEVLHKKIISGDVELTIEETPIGRKAAIGDVLDDMDGRTVRANSQVDLLEYIEAIDKGAYDVVDIPEEVKQEFAELAATAIPDVESSEVLERLSG